MEREQDTDICIRETVWQLEIERETQRKIETERDVEMEMERERDWVPTDTTYFHALPSRNGAQWPQSAQGPHRAERGHIVGSGPDRSQIY